MGNTRFDVDVTITLTLLQFVGKTRLIDATGAYDNEALTVYVNDLVDARGWKALLSNPDDYEIRATHARTTHGQPSSPVGPALSPATCEED